MLHLVLMLGLFHHGDRPSKKAVLSFTRAAESMLQSYRDNSTESWLEAEQIKQMESQIEYLAAHPGSKYAKQLEEKIKDGMDELYNFDQNAQKELLTAFPDTHPI